MKSPMPGAARKVQAVGHPSLTRTLAGTDGELRSHTHKQPMAASSFSCSTKHLDAISRQHMFEGATCGVGSSYANHLQFRRPICCQYHAICIPVCSRSHSPPLQYGWVVQQQALCDDTCSQCSCSHVIQLQSDFCGKAPAGSR